MYVCIYIYICISVCVCVHGECKCKCQFGRVSVHMYECLSVHECSCVRMQVHVLHIHTYIHTHTPPHRYLHTHRVLRQWRDHSCLLHIYIHTYIHTYPPHRYLHTHRVLPINNGETITFEQGYSLCMKPRPSKIHVQLFFSAAKLPNMVRKLHLYMYVCMSESKIHVS